MKNRMRIVLAEDEVALHPFFTDALERLGHEVLSIATTGRQLVSACEQLQPDLVITDVAMPELNGLDAAVEIYAHRAVPIIVVSALQDESVVEQAGSAHVMAYLIKPISEARLAVAITIARERFADIKSLHDEVANLRQAIEDRKVIERAKGLLMTRQKLSEPEAFRQLQKIARNGSVKMVEVANILLATDGATIR